MEEHKVEVQEGVTLRAPSGVKVRHAAWSREACHRCLDVSVVGVEATIVLL